MVRENDEKVFVFEDDAIPHRNFTALFRELPHRCLEADVLLLGATIWHKKHTDWPSGACFDASSATFGAFALFLKRVSYRPILQWLQAGTPKPFDHVYRHLQQKNLSVRVAFPPFLVIPDISHPSLINKKRSDIQFDIQCPQDDELPEKMPIVHEASLKFPWNDTIELIYTSAPEPSGFIWLFGQGVVGQTEHMFCLLGRQRTSLKEAKKSTIFNDYIAFLCHLSQELEFGDKLTIVNGEKIVNSVARYNPQHHQTIKKPRYFLCFVTTIKNMAYLVDEWYEYHRRVGFDHLIIYDNNSTDGLEILFPNRADLEIIRWPWRRSQHQAYTHALLFTRDRCVWTLFSDLDVFIFPRSSNSVRSIIQNQARSDITQISFKLLRMSHENLVECSNTSITETYIHRKRLPDAWDKNPSAAVITSLAVPVHQIHEAELLKPYKSIILSSDIAYGVHYSDRCWKQYFSQKVVGRTGVKDWIVPKTVSILHPSENWQKLSKEATIKDTEFRDFKRKIMRMPMPKPAIF
ncbi:unnamed protein product [Rotaria sp. Silwood2]|nr:unnamed protein product [Rotaria sp. Silwood2]CAF4421750.1 unnamed protein product [Rotaria sp. Silwood2]